MGNWLELVTDMFITQVTMLICNNGKVNKSGTGDFDTSKFIEKAKKFRRRN